MEAHKRLRLPINLLGSRSSSAARLLKARILLKADVSEAGEGWSDSRIVEALETSVSMVYRVRKQWVEEGLEAVLSGKPPARPSVPRIFDGEKEARLIALACSKPPEGHARWSLRLLESKVEFGIVEAASDSTIQRVLKKTIFSRTAANTGSSRPGLNETSKQLVAETRLPIAMKPGRPARVDCEYERNGTANLFMMFAPTKAGATSRSLIAAPPSTMLRFCKTWPAAEARRLVGRFEWHYTPKHGSWLNLAESELGVLASQCLDRRIPDKPTIADEVAA